MITVYHNSRFTELAFSASPAETFRAEGMETSLEKVAEVQADDLDDAFRLTNHIDQEWFKNPEVKTIKESRSTSVGDVMEKDGKRFIVANFGFEEIT